MRDREREEPSTLILETSAVAEQHKPEGMVGDGERSMVEVDEDAETGIRCGTTDEEEADAEIGSTTSEGRNAKHPTLSLADQVTSVHLEEPQRDAKSDGTKDDTTRRQDRQDETRAIGMNGESCLGKWRRCVENGGLRTGKRKRGVPECQMSDAPSPVRFWLAKTFTSG